MAVYVVRVGRRDITIVDGPVHVAHAQLSRTSARICAFPTAVEALSFAKRFRQQSPGHVSVKRVDAEDYIQSQGLAGLS